MSQLTRAEAANVLRESLGLADLAEAVGVLIDDPATCPEELLPALDHGGFVAEQAAIALHRMTGAPCGNDDRPITARTFWAEALASRAKALSARRAGGASRRSKPAHSDKRP